MEYKTINYTKKDGIATVTLNRPASMNALNTQVFGELQHIFSRTETDDDVKVVVITGSEKFFAAGADIMELANIATPLDVQRYARLSRDVFRQIEAAEKPLIAAVSGFALGGGCELTLVCDLRIVSESAVFGLPEIKIGVLPGGGGTQRLPRLVGTTKAKELLYTGDNIDAQEAIRIGEVIAVPCVARPTEPLPRLIGDFLVPAHIEGEVPVHVHHKHIQRNVVKAELPDQVFELFISICPVS